MLGFFNKNKMWNRFCLLYSYKNKTSEKFMRNKLIIALLLVPFAFFAQIPTKQEAREIAQSQIVQLKSSVLLVRLYNKRNVIKALEEKGMVKRANAVKKKQKKTNKEIVAAFEKFTFCEVYYFFSNDSPSLINGDYSKVELLSDSENKGEIVLEGPNFFVADFGVLKNENAKNSKTDGSSKSGKTKVKQYTGGTKSANKRCMFLRDNKLNQLKRPFPYTVWFHPNPIQSLSYQEVVERMDNQLKEFYINNK